MPPCLSLLSPGQRLGYVLVYCVQGNTKWHWSILCVSLPLTSALLPEPCLQLWLQAQCLGPPAAVGWGCSWIRISSTLMCIHAGCLRSPCKLGYSQASPQQTWPPGCRLPENSASHGYHILLCGFCRGRELSLSKGIIYLEWSLITKPQNLRLSHLQKPCLQLFFLVVWVEKKYRTSLKPTIARGVLSKCRGYDKIASCGSGKTRRVECCSELCCALCQA